MVKGTINQTWNVQFNQTIIIPFITYFNHHLHTKENQRESDFMTIICVFPHILHILYKGKTYPPAWLVCSCCLPLPLIID